MQVTCSSCGARYAVDPAAIGPTGRTVQCVRCGHRWHAQPDAAPAAAAAPDGSLPPPQSVPDFVIRPQSPGAGLPALRQPEPKIRWGRWLIGAVVLLAALSALALAFRTQIRDRIPPAFRPVLGLDAGHGAAVPSPAAARPARPDRARLELDLDASKVEWADGQYVVVGEIINSGRQPGSTARLKVSFRKDGELLGERAYPLVVGPVAPGARASFRLKLEEPPAGTTEIVLAVD